MLRRFKHEAETLGPLQHPGIACIYEAGIAKIESDDGVPYQRPFIAMELIRGTALTEYVATRDLTTRQRLDLVSRICDAVQHAHQKGVIHRDLKPGNVLVDETGQPKIVDFGVARATNADMQTVTMQTDVGQLIGTIPYMSPEQVTGDSRQLDTRSDVYSLGVILYELLGGSVPHDVSALAIPEAVRRIRDDEPVPLGSIDKELRGELETIAARALEKDRTRRYQSASDLATDIRHYLRGEAIEAKADSRLYLLRKTLKRHREFALATCLLFVLLAMFAIVSSIQATHNRRLAEKADSEANELRHALYVNRIGYALHAITGNDVGRAARLLQECPSDLRSWEWRYLWRLSDRSTRTLPRAVGFLHSAAMTPDGSRLATWNWSSGVLTVFDVRTKLRLHSFQLGQHCEAISLSPDSRTFAAVDRGMTLFLRDLATGVSVMRIHDDQQDKPSQTSEWTRAVAFSPDGAKIVSGANDGRLTLWNARTEAVTRSWEANQGEIVCVAFTRDGKRILAGGQDGTIRVWDVNSVAQGMVLSGYLLPIHSLAVSPDGNLLASGSNDRTIKLWHISTGRQVATLTGHDATIPYVGFSPDGLRLVSGSADHTIGLWDIVTHRLVDRLRGHVDAILFVSFTPDGRQLVSPSREGTLKWWQARPRPATPTIDCKQGQTIAVAFDPHGERVLSTGSDGTIKVWDVQSFALELTLSGHTAPTFSAAFSPNGERIVSGSNDHTVRLWDANTGYEVDSFRGHSAPIYSVVFDQDGTYVLSADASGVVKLWEVSTLNEVLSLNAHDVITVAGFSPDGEKIVTGGRDGLMKLWSASTGMELLRVQAHRHSVYWVEFSPDGSNIASSGGAEDDNVKVWDGRTGQLLLSCLGHRTVVHGHAFSPDGSRLASGGADRTVRIWDVRTGEELLTLHGHDLLVHKVAFSPDGTHLASSSDDGTVRLWEAPFSD